MVIGKRSRALVAVLVVIATGVSVGAAAPATAIGENIWEVENVNATVPVHYRFDWGAAPRDCRPVTGDWDGIGGDATGLVCPHQGQWMWLMTDRNDSSPPAYWYFWGVTGCLPVVGDWDGNGSDTPGQVCAEGTAWRWQGVNVHNVTGRVDTNVLWGTTAGCWPVPGDWDGNRTHDPGVVCPQSSTWQWRQKTTGADRVFAWGTTAGCNPTVGDWDGNGTDTPGSTCKNGTATPQWRLHPANAAAGTDLVFSWGYAHRTQITGDWDGNGSSTVGQSTASSPAGLWYLANGRGSDRIVLSRAGYDYQPTVMRDGVYRMWWCGAVNGDYIVYGEAYEPSGQWWEWYPVFGPSHGTNHFDNLHTCDPSVIRVGGTYYMYYGAAQNAPGVPTQMGLAWSQDGLNWGRLGDGWPILSIARPLSSVPSNRHYGVGQPSVTYVDGRFYLIHTDSTGYAGDGNGGGQYVLRSWDPAFRYDVETLTANGFVPRTATNHTTHSLVYGFGVDWVYSDMLQAFIIAMNGPVGGATVFRFFDKSLTREIRPPMTLPAGWREGPGIIRRPDGHAAPGWACGLVPLDLMHAAGGDPNNPYSWDFAHNGADLITGQDCDSSNLPQVLEGTKLIVSGQSLATVVDGQRVHWGSMAAATHFARTELNVSLEMLGKVPLAGSIHYGAPVYGAEGRPAAFLGDGRLFPVDCTSAITANGSSIAMISVASYDAYPKGPALRCIR
ncbi:MAG TPA: hypothetical protein VF062_11690 [Candidatus Limnocylindrales bacterium]